MKQILSRIINHEELTQAETKEIMINITQERYNDSQLAALLMGIQMRGITVDELLGFREGLLETGLAVDLTPFKPIDIVGTGGDGKNTFNISTCSCFVVAGAGYKVAKHGNYAATSVSGAGNVIEEHGVTFTNDNEKLKQCLDEVGFIYMHAPLFARGMKYVGPTRKNLQVPTCFNLLGPLVNPCRPPYQLLGVANPQQLRLYSRVYEKMGINYGIVTSVDGYDEISLTSEFKVKRNGFERIYSPEELGFAIAKPEELFGGSTKEEAKQIFDNVLEGKATVSQTNVVLANAAFAINIIESEKTYEECLAIAKESLDSKAALNVLKKYVAFNAK
ncbi:MAG: anthranilate phosphoribosyltransferase [Bacteroidales bacterium]|nr:anthranilate phosphoribosyltransferase [Bacteroidales bacterium]